MANENNDKPAEVAPDKLKEHNAEVAAQLAAQDSAGHSAAPDPFNADTSNALDAIVTAKKKAAEDEPVEGAKPTDKSSEGAKPDAKSADDSAAKPADDKPVEGAKPATRPADVEPTLPPGASPKSHEAFAAIKAKAAQDISQRDAEIEKLKKAIAERDEKLKSPIPKELADEVEELRKFRAKFDIEADPQFKTFDKSVETAHEFIYDQLKKSPAITEDIIEAIKKHGGPENVKMEKIFAAMSDPSLQRLVEIKLTEIESAKFAKAQAIKTAKDNVASYIKERQEAFTKSATAHNEATMRKLDEIMPTLDWLKDRAADPKAEDKEADAKAVAEHNKFAGEVRQQLEAAIQDDTPEMRAILLAGFAQLLNYQRAREIDKAKMAAQDKQIEELTSKLARFKQAGRLNKDDTGAAPGGQVLPKKETDPFNTRAGDALDAIKAQIAQEQARKQQ